MPRLTTLTETKYYSFAGQRVAMCQNGVLPYLHSDHLGSTVMETNANSAMTTNEKYCAYGRTLTVSGSTMTRDSDDTLVTDHRLSVSYTHLLSASQR